MSFLSCTFGNECFHLFLPVSGSQVVPEVLPDDSVVGPIVLDKGPLVPSHVSAEGTGEGGLGRQICDEVLFKVFGQVGVASGCCGDAQ